MRSNWEALSHWATVSSARMMPSLHLGAESCLEKACCYIIQFSMEFVFAQVNTYQRTGWGSLRTFPLAVLQIV